MPNQFAVVSDDEARRDPYPFVYVNDDGSVRELHAQERRYLETPFAGSDGARPYVKSTFEQRDGWGKLGGYCSRLLVPAERDIAPAPLNDPHPPMTSDEYVERRKRKVRDNFERGPGEQ